MPKNFLRLPLDKQIGAVYTVYIVYIQYSGAADERSPKALPRLRRGREISSMRCTMDIIISNSDRAPIYEQIVRQLKGQILSGQLAEGEALPSMRLLARDLRISVITTKRAYEELEREGFLTTVPGKGSFVAAQNRETRREAVLCQIEEHLSQAVDAARAGAVGLDELTEMLNTLYQED